MIYTLLPPTAPEVLSSIAPFDIDTFKKQEKISVTEFCNNMFETMKNYGGIGLSANQVGLPFNMFVIGGHPSIEKGLKMTCFNPMIVSTGEDEIMMKEGCLTYPFIFLDIKRPRKIVAKYTDEKGDLQEAHLDGMMSRIFQHEYDHMLGRNFTEKVSKFKLKRAMAKREKMIKKIEKSNKA